MALTPSEVQKIAHLARLSINESEIESLAHDLDNILQLVDKMNRVNVNEIQPMAHPLDALQPLRTDQATTSDQRDLFLNNAPQSLMGLYVVPAVLETEE
ncbi:MAG: Asp-tRNA(Asn)/Glu-tRNA(Gln) amidotransferase subunit GatC [Proteobacteria bacterium]|nr:Asp-tRNA(Asn)/Glu-tRNA(Gln) amidotransferase subunit GatC [Pseudomonadota bacterium]